MVRGLRCVLLRSQNIHRSYVDTSRRFKIENQTLAFTISRTCVIDIGVVYAQFNGAGVIDHNNCFYSWQESIIVGRIGLGTDDDCTDANGCVDRDQIKRLARCRINRFEFNHCSHFFRGDSVRSDHWITCDRAGLDHVGIDFIQHIERVLCRVRAKCDRKHSRSTNHRNAIGRQIAFAISHQTHTLVDKNQPLPNRGDIKDGAI